MLLAADAGLAARYRERWLVASSTSTRTSTQLQYELLRLLATPDGNLCAIGDPDQAIYSFRGADVGFFLRFARGLPGRHAPSG